MVVQDKDSLTAAVDFLGRIATAKKEVDSRRRFFTDPLNQQVKSINDLFRGYTDPLAKADKIVRNKVLIYQAEEAKRVDEEQRKAAEGIASALTRRGQTHWPLLPELLPLNIPPITCHGGY